MSQEFEAQYTNFSEECVYTPDEPTIQAAAHHPYEGPVIDKLAGSLETFMAKPFRRRALFTAVGAMAAVHAMSKIEDIVMDAHYQSNGTEIILPSNARLRPPLTSASVASSGWNGVSGAGIVDSLKNTKIYAQNYPIGYYQFGSGMTVDSIGDCTKQFADALRLRTMDIHGISEGGIIAMTGALKAKRPLRIISTNDSPFDINDVKHAWFAKGVVFASEIGLYHGDIFGKFATYMLDEIETRGLRDAFKKDAVDDAWHQTWDKLDPRLTLEQLTVLKEADIWSRRDEVRRIANADTNFIILKTQQINTDPITKDDQSTEKWAALAEYCGASYKVVEVPAPNHAQVGAGYRAAAPHMRQILDELRS